MSHRRFQKAGKLPSCLALLLSQHLHLALFEEGFSLQLTVNTKFLCPAIKGHNQKDDNILTHS